MPEKCLSTTYLSIFTLNTPNPPFAGLKALVLLAFGVGGSSPNAPPMPPMGRFAGGVGSHVRGRKGCLKLEPRKLDTGVQKD
jgi:hypothetical protein